MKITRSKDGVKITLPKYKITVRKITGTKESYQYTCVLPPLLCSFFQIGTVENITPEEDIYNRLLMFFELDNNKIVMAANDFYKAEYSTHKHKLNEMITNTHGYETNTDLVKYCEENPINFSFFDRIQFKEADTTRVYKLKSSNTYKLTLPSRLFKQYIQHSKPNYIQFTIDTSKEDLQFNKGLVTYEILN